MPITTRARPDEYAAFYADYISLVPPGDLLAAMIAQIDELHVLAVRAEEPGPGGCGPDFRYAEGKWTLRELFRHVEETERVLAYRALRIARGDPTPLPGFDQDVFIEGGAADLRSPSEIATAMEHLRHANVSLFAAFDDDALARRGRMWDKDGTVLAVLHIVYGHAAHHLRVVEERYLS